MLSRPTTFVIGAGASFDLNIPTGDGLQKIICQVLATDRSSGTFSNKKLTQSIQSLARRSGDDFGLFYGKYLEASRKIVRGMPSAASIDNFLHTHRDDEVVVHLGKMAIALSILEAESKSHLRYQGLTITTSSFQFLDGYVNSWYYNLIKMLTSGTLNDDPVSIFSNISLLYLIMIDVWK